MKQIVIGLFAILLVGCANQEAATRLAAEIPRYSGAVTIVDQPITFPTSALDRRATFSMQKSTDTNANGRTQKSREHLTGYIDGNNIGGKTQVNYVVDRMNSGSGLQQIPTLILQFTYGQNGELERAEFGGAMLAQARSEERAAVNAAGEILLEAFRRFQIGGAKTYRQGDIVQSFRLKDFMDDLAPIIPSKAIVTRGSGYTYRLAGQTARKGRRAYVMVIDGSEEFISGSDSLICTMSGYVIVDAATGLFSEIHSLTAIGGQKDGAKVQIREISMSAIDF